MCVLLNETYYLLSDVKTLTNIGEVCPSEQENYSVPTISVCLNTWKLLLFMGQDDSFFWTRSEAIFSSIRRAAASELPIAIAVVVLHVAAVPQL